MERNATASDHECSACGGTGRIHRDHRTAECWHKSHFCPACHGSGRISDVMPVSDALADAETLWSIGGAGLVQLVECPLVLSIPDPAVAAIGARAFATAAFRAVPGLRGE